MGLFIERNEHDDNNEIVWMVFEINTRLVQNA